MHVFVAMWHVSDVTRPLFIYNENRTEVHDKKQLHHQNTSRHLKARPIA